MRATTELKKSTSTIFHSSKEQAQPMRPYRTERKVIPKRYGLSFTDPRDNELIEYGRKDGQIRTTKYILDLISGGLTLEEIANKMRRNIKFDTWCRSVSEEDILSFES